MAGTKKDQADEAVEATPSSEAHAETPTGLATAAVGEPKKGASDEELVAHGEKYLDAYLKARRG